MQAESAELRAAAIELWSDWTDAELRDHRRSLLLDPEPQVRQAVAWSLAAAPDPSAAERLLRALERDQADPYLAASYHAAMDGETARNVLQLAMKQPELLASARMQHVLTAACTGDARQRLDVLRWLAEDAPISNAAEGDLTWRWRVLRSWLAAPGDGRGGVDTSPSDVVEGARSLVNLAAEHLKEQVAATDAALAAVALLAQPYRGDQLSGGDLRDDAQARAALIAALQPDREALLQQEALRGLAALGAPGAAEELVRLLDQSSPALHDALLDALLDREAWALVLADYFGEHPDAWRRLDPCAASPAFAHRRRQIARRVAGSTSGSRPAESRTGRVCSPDRGDHEPKGHVQSSSERRRSRARRAVVPQTLLGLPSPGGRGQRRRPQPGCAHGATSAMVVDGHA